MRIPLTRDGWKEMAGLTAVCAVGAVGAWLWWWPLAVVPVAIGLWGIAFFRDPERRGPSDPDVLVAPADGKVVAVDRVDDSRWFDGPATRVDIFLSVFNVHINRMPCAGAVVDVVRRGGLCLNALRAEASERNVSCAVVIDPDAVAGPIVTRQITGVLARRIVCHAERGRRYATGQRYGMIKFGSRTELYIPAGSAWQVTVEPGAVVRAGVTVLARHRGAVDDGGATHDEAAAATG